MDEIRTAALAAVAEVDRDVSGVSSVIRATKLVYDRLGCSVIEARDAVRWALDHPSAATLPEGSVVAGIDCTFMKHANAAEPDQPWSGGPDRRFVNDYTNDEIDDMIQQGAVRVLRVGDGS